MKEYHKIHTVFKRDMESKKKTLLDGQWTFPEFKYLASNEWVFTEKVDGTNIRVMIDNGAVIFGGKTDNAQIPAPLVERLTQRFLSANQFAKLNEIFPSGACLYGEGYGPKIQPNGGNYRTDQDFVLFDIKVGEWYLQRGAIVEIAKQLGLDIVPVVLVGSLIEAIEHVRFGFDSRWGPFKAEGLVGRPSIELKARNGDRIITKIKCRDFDKRANE